MADGRFGQTTEEELNRNRLSINADKTIKSNKLPAKILKDYLSEKQMDCDFEDFDEVKLDEVLSHFYVDARKTDGGMYKATSLESIRHAIDRYLKSTPHNKKYDIIKDSAFIDANASFKADLCELKRLGKDEVEHYPIISEADRTKLYGSMYMSNDTPVGLQNKVQFDIRLDFCRRSNENMREMTKDTFSVPPSGRRGGGGV